MPSSFSRDSASRRILKSLNGDGMGVPSPRIEHSRSLPVKNQRPARPCSSIQNSIGVQVEKQSMAEDTRNRSADDSNMHDFLKKDCSDPLRHLMAETDNASSKEKAAGHFYVNSVLEKKSYKIYVSLGLPICP